MRAGAAGPAVLPSLKFLAGRKRVYTPRQLFHTFIRLFIPAILMVFHHKTGVVVIKQELFLIS